MSGIKLATIQDGTGKEVGRVEKWEADPPVRIYMDDMRWKNVGKKVNSAILDGKELMGMDGVGRVIDGSFTEEQQTTVYTAIELISHGQLQIIRTAIDPCP